METDSQDNRKTVSFLDKESSTYCSAREPQLFTNCSQSTSERAENNIAQGKNLVKPLLKCTRQLNSDKPYYVYEDMLNYRGEKSSDKYIAPKCKREKCKERMQIEFMGSPVKRKLTLEQLMDNLSISENVSKIPKVEKDLMFLNSKILK